VHVVRFLLTVFAPNNYNTRDCFGDKTSLIVLKADSSSEARTADTLKHHPRTSIYNRIRNCPPFRP